MVIKPIHTEEDYQNALNKIEKLFNSEPGTPNGDALEVLVVLVEAYEKEHYSIPFPDPIEAIEYHMERLGLARKDLEVYIGGPSRVSEILNRKRPLNIRMIRNLSKGLGIPVDILAQPYELIDAEPEANVSTDFSFAGIQMAEISSRNSSRETIPLRKTTQHEGLISAYWLQLHSEAGETEDALSKEATLYKNKVYSATEGTIQ